MECEQYIDHCSHDCGHHSSTKQVLVSVSNLVACDWGRAKLLDASVVGSQSSRRQSLVDLIVQVLEAVPPTPSPPLTYPSASEVALRILLHVALSDSVSMCSLLNKPRLLSLLNAHPSETAQRIVFVLSSRFRSPVTAQSSQSSVSSGVCTNVMCIHIYGYLC